MANKQTNATRRQALVGFGAIAAASAAPAMSFKPTRDRTAWDAAIADYKRAIAHAMKCGERHGIAETRYMNALPRREELDLRYFPKSFVTPAEIERTLDLDELWQGYLDAEGKTWWGNNPDECKARARAAIDRVRAYREQVAEAKRSTNIEAIEREWEDALDRGVEAQHRLLKMPAPDERALAFKLSILLHDDNNAVASEFIVQSRRDIEALLGKPEAEYF